MNKMEVAKFVKGLTVLSERHEHDNVSVFDTDWSRLCKEAANYILELSRTVEEQEEELLVWGNWYNENESKILKALGKGDAIDIPIYKEKEPIPTSVWDGIRRDVGIGGNENE